MFQVKPHQPLTFKFPKRLGRNRLCTTASNLVGFLSDPFFTVCGVKDVAFCHTYLMGFKLNRMRTNSADPAFVS